MIALGSDHAGFEYKNRLKKLLDEITREQQIEIKAYSRKLNSIILFYLIIACVMPSLGIAMFIIIAGLMNFHIDLSTMFMFLFFTTLIQLFFISIIRSSRPMVDI